MDMVRCITAVVICLLLTFQPKAQDTTLISADTLRYWVQALSHDSMQGRMTGTLGNELAGKFIASEFRRIGLRKIAGNDGYFASFEVPMPPYGKLVSANNVMGVIPGNGNSDKLIIFCAHYDHIGSFMHERYFRNPMEDNDTMGADTIYNGANDNASGVAALLELANYFKQAPKPEHTLIFVAFSAEELGLFGARAMAEWVDPSKVVQVINLEMLGRPENLPNQRPFVTFKEREDHFIDQLNRNYRKATGIRKDFFLYDLFLSERLFLRSDNLAFAEKGIRSNTIMATHPKDKYYHQPGDEWQTLDYHAMESIVRKIALALQPLVW